MLGVEDSPDLEPSASSDPPGIPAEHVPAPEGFIELTEVALPGVGEVVEVVVGETILAVANVEGAFHAISGVCPHAGGPLGEGTVDGMVVWCPFHRWSFHLETGVASVGGRKLVDVYEVREQSGRLYIRL